MTSPTTRHIDTFEIDWQGIRIRISYEADYLGMLQSYGAGSSPVQVQSIAPERSRLPITETGYRSHFGEPDAVSAAGGPVAFVVAWLEYAARQAEWQAYSQQNRQLSLF